MSPMDSPNHSTMTINVNASISPSVRKLCQMLEDARGIKSELNDHSSSSSPTTLLNLVSALSATLSAHGHDREAVTLIDVLTLCTADTDFGGFGLKHDQSLNSKQEADILFTCSAWFEALNSVDRAKAPTAPLATRPEGRRPMTMTEKIFAAHDTQRKGFVKPGDIVQVDVDWVLASELSWTVSLRPLNLHLGPICLRCWPTGH